MPNTYFEYLYRDEENNKARKAVVLVGEGLTLTDIQPYLNQGEYFIPHQVGLEDLQETFAPHGGYIQPDVDDVWHKIEEISLTETMPTVEMTAVELKVRFASIMWDEAEARTTLGLDDGGEYEDEGGVSPLVDSILAELEGGPGSEAMGVADTLRTIAANGEGQEKDDFLVECAKQIVEAAQYFIDRVTAGQTTPGSSRGKPLVIKELELVGKVPYNTWNLTFTCPVDNQPEALMADLIEAGWIKNVPAPPIDNEIRVYFSRPGRGLFSSWQPHETEINLAELESILCSYGLGLPPKRQLKMEDLI